MNSFKWALITDLHFGVRETAKVFQTIFREFYAMFFQMLIDHNIKTIIVGGDFFERRKFINYETLELAKEIFFNRAKELGIEVHMIAGNHDVYFKNTNKLNSLDLLISKEEYPNVHLYTQTAEEVVIDGQKILFVPWINKENYPWIMDSIDKTDARIMISHLEMSGFEYHRGVISDRGHLDADYLSKFDYVLSGHYHHRSSRGNIHYLGTAYETSWNDYDDQKGFHFFTQDGLEFIENPNVNFFKIYYDEREPVIKLRQRINALPLENKYIKLVVRSKKNLGDYEGVVELLETKNASDLNIIDETNYVNDSSDDDVQDEGIQDTLTVIKRYVDTDLETDLDKNRLINNMHKLYTLALEMTDGD